MHSYVAEGHCRDEWKWYTRIIVGLLVIAVFFALVLGAAYGIRYYWPYVRWGIAGCLTLGLAYTVGVIVENITWG